MGRTDLHADSGESQHLQLHDRTVDLQRRLIIGPGQATTTLTPIEARLLTFLAAPPGRVRPREELMNQVWEYQPTTFSHTLSTTISRLRRKLEVTPSKPEFLKSVYGVGYRLDLPAQDSWDPQGSQDSPLQRGAAPLTRFFGREQQLAQLAEYLNGDRRLVVITGPPGVGKTRLAAHFTGERATCPTRFVDLTEARSTHDLLRVVSEALTLRSCEADPINQVEEALRARGELLLVLDNVEHLVTPARSLVARWLRCAPTLRLLVTSRRALQLSGEQRLPLPPLAITASDDGPGAAVSLFLDRAAAARGVPLPSEELADVTALAALLDGLPLALELAAARTDLLSPSALRRRLSARLDLLSRPSTDPRAASRHSSLRRALDSSWALLSPTEREALTQLAVFRGPFTVEDAEAVLTLSGDGDPLSAVHALVENHLLQPSADLTPRRFSLLLSIRQYAAEHLTEADRRRASARLGAHLARSWELETLHPFSTGRGEVRRQVYRDRLPDLLALAREALYAGPPQLAATLVSAAANLLLRSGPPQDGLALLDEALALALDAETTLRLHWDRGLLREVAGDLVGATADLTAALAIAERRGARVREGAIRAHLGIVLISRSQLDAAAVHLERAPELLAAAGARLETGIALSNLSALWCYRGQIAEATRLQERALALHIEMDNREHRATSLTNIASLLMVQGQTGRAGALYRQALAYYVDIGDLRREGIERTNLANVACIEGELEQAELYYREALRLHRLVGDRAFEGITLGNLALLLWKRRRGPPGTPVPTACWTGFQESLSVHRALTDHRQTAAVLTNLAEAYLHAGEIARAQSALEEALAVITPIGDPTIEGIIQGGLGWLLALEGDGEVAGALLEAGTAALRQTGARVELGKLLSRHGRAACRRNEPTLAHDALRELEALAEALAAPANAELIPALQALRAELASDIPTRPHWRSP